MFLIIIVVLVSSPLRILLMFITFGTLEEVWKPSSSYSYSLSVNFLFLNSSFPDLMKFYFSSWTLSFGEELSFSSMCFFSVLDSKNWSSKDDISGLPSSLSCGCWRSAIGLTASSSSSSLLSSSASYSSSSSSWTSWMLSLWDLKSPPFFSTGDESPMSSSSAIRGSTISSIELLKKSGIDSSC